MSIYEQLTKNSIDQQEAIIMQKECDKLWQLSLDIELRDAENANKKQLIEDFCNITNNFHLNIMLQLIALKHIHDKDEVFKSVLNNKQKPNNSSNQYKIDRDTMRFLQNNNAVDKNFMKKLNFLLEQYNAQQNKLGSKYNSIALFCQLFNIEIIVIFIVFVITHNIVLFITLLPIAAVINYICIKLGNQLFSRNSDASLSSNSTSGWQINPIDWVYQQIQFMKEVSKTYLHQISLACAISALFILLTCALCLTNGIMIAFLSLPIINMLAALIITVLLVAEVTRCIWQKKQQTQQQNMQLYKQIKQLIEPHSSAAEDNLMITLGNRLGEGLSDTMNNIADWWCNQLSPLIEQNIHNLWACVTQHANNNNAQPEPASTDSGNSGCSHKVIDELPDSLFAGPKARAS
jgi:Flp pilus assembly protein TadB